MVSSVWSSCSRLQKSRSEWDVEDNMLVLIQQSNRAIVKPLTMLPMILFDPLWMKTILLVDERKLHILFIIIFLRRHLELLVKITECGSSTKSSYYFVSEYLFCLSQFACNNRNVSWLNGVEKFAPASASWCFFAWIILENCNVYVQFLVSLLHSTELNIWHF